MVLETELARNGNLWNQNWLGIGLGGIEHIPAITSYDNFPGLLPTDNCPCFLNNFETPKTTTNTNSLSREQFSGGKLSGVSCQGKLFAGNCPVGQLSRGNCPGLHFATYHESVYSCTKRVGLLYDMLKNDEELVLDSGTRLGLDLAWTRLGLDSASVWLGSARTRSLLDSARLGLGVGGLDYSPGGYINRYI